MTADSLALRPSPVDLRAAAADARAKKAAIAGARTQAARILMALASAGHMENTPSTGGMPLSTLVWRTVRSCLPRRPAQSTAPERLHTTLREALEEVLVATEERVLAHRQARLDAQAQCALAQARLALLQGQFDPDFLFNNLASVQFLIFKDITKADFMLSHLVQYLRRSSNALRLDASSLGAEMELVESYLHLAAIRMGTRLNMHVTCPEQLKKLHFPPMVLHALVDNAIKHAAEPSLVPVLISVNAYSHLGRICIDVTDDGRGLQGGRRNPDGKGLINVSQRVSKQFGSDASLVVVDRPEGGVLARIEIRTQEAAQIGNI